MGGLTTGSPPSLDDIEWVMWAGTIGFDAAIPDRIAAAHATGCTTLSLGAPDVARWEAEGGSAEELGRWIRDEGLEIGMDPVAGWHGGPPLWGPFGAFTLDEELRIGEALGVTSMTAIGPFAPGDVPVTALPERFARLCDRAAGLGARVHYEFMPISAVTDATTAWEIVAAADRVNGGVAFDTWHFFRGDPDVAALERIPGDRIFCVQVSDAPAEVRGSLREDTLDRLLPGDGVFDLVGVLAVLDRLGGLRRVGPEVISPSTAAMTPVDAARRAMTRLREVVTRARSVADPSTR